MRAFAAASLAALLALPGSLARAEEPALPPDVAPVEHVVQPGETLIGLTLQELGEAALWPHNWRLNPDLKDPHHIDPGQRILIYRRGGAPSAEIRALSQHVDKKPHPDPTWVAASVGDPLRERDGVRTYEKSSAELAFDDGARLTLGEQSLVFLQRVGTSLRGAPMRTLEIVEGQADLRSQKAEGERPLREVEILVGGARTTTRPGPSPNTEARARRSAEGGAQMMLYAGESEVEAAGRTVGLKAGQGTAVPKGGAPRPPEALLEAPLPSLPLPDARFDHANPRFAWAPVRGARSYSIEVCRDALCGELVERATGLSRPQWTPVGLPVGQLFWRVAAVSASGLDGFPSTPQTVQISTLWRRPAPTR